MRPIPEEVKAIFALANKVKYDELCKAGWCVSCYREHAVLGVRCPKCQATYLERQEKRNRDKGIMPWEPGKKGRPPKSKGVK